MEPAEWIGGLVAGIGALSTGLSAAAARFLVLDASIRVVTNQFEGLVKALSPATAAAFERAMQNLNATLGQAVVPVFQTLVLIVDKLAGVVSPLAAQLGPIFDNLAAGLTRPFLDLAHAAVEVGAALASAFDYLIPVITAAADVIALLLSAGIAALVQEAIALGKSLTGAGSALDMVRNSAQEASKQVLLFAARLAASLGGFGFIDNLIRFIQREDTARGLQAAPTGVKTQDFASIAREMAQAAFAAGPGGTQKNERQYLNDILNELFEIRKNNVPQTWQKVIEDGTVGLRNALERLFPDTFNPDNYAKWVGGTVAGENIRDILRQRGVRDAIIGGKHGPAL